MKSKLAFKTLVCSVLMSYFLCSCASLQRHVYNGCAITATNYQAAMEAKHALDPSFHSRILVVEYTDKNGEKTAHAYCLWRAKGIYYAYDYSGTQVVYLRNSKMPSAMVFAIQLKPFVISAYYEGEFGPEYVFENS